MDLGQLEDLLRAWIDTPSISGSERDYLQVLEARLAASGWCLRRQPVAEGRWNLVATASAQVAPQVVFCTHVDVVPPHLPFRQDGDRYYGRGACDTKGILVAMLAAAEALRATHPRGDALGFLLVVGEETDHCGAARARDLDLHPAAFILGEPTRGRVVSDQKGAIKVRLRARGKAAHSSLPEEGSSAIEPLLDALQALRNASWPHHPVLGPTTLNIGELHAGVAANVIPPLAEASLMFRIVSPGAQVLQQVRALCAGLEIDEELCDDPQHLTVPPPPPAGPDWPRAVVAFNTDARYLKALGPVVLVGPGDIARAHGDDEYLTRTELLDGIALYVRLAGQLLDSAGA